MQFISIKLTGVLYDRPLVTAMHALATARNVSMPSSRSADQFDATAQTSDITTPRRGAVVYIYKNKQDKPAPKILEKIEYLIRCNKEGELDIATTVQDLQTCASNYPLCHGTICVEVCYKDAEETKTALWDILVSANEADNAHAPNSDIEYLIACLHDYAHEFDPQMNIDESATTGRDHRKSYVL